MSFDERIHKYVLTGGGVPPHVAQLVELEQQVGEKFIFNSKFDASIARMWLGLTENLPRKLPDEERLRLANLLRRAGKISDEELMKLGMVAIPIQDALSRVQENRERDQPPLSRYDPLPFASFHRRDW